jgi:hypothetical protein
LAYLCTTRVSATSITIERLPWERRRIAYTTFVRPYNEAHQKISFVETELPKVHAIDWSKEPGVGIYDDPPGVTKPEDCRSVIGEFIPDSFEARPLDGVRFGSLENMPDTVQVRYPLRSVLCIFASMMCIYPGLTLYWKERGNTTGLRWSNSTDFMGRTLCSCTELGRPMASCVTGRGTKEIA